MTEAVKNNVTIDEIYYLETLEQMEAFASSIRYRMVSYLTTKPKTSAQLGRDLGIARPKAHYHLQVLAKLGLARFVDEALVNGIVEKYYIGRARFFSFDHLNEYAVSHPEDRLFCEKFTALKKRFLISMLEVTRDKIFDDKEGRSSTIDFSFDFGFWITEEQRQEIIEMLSQVATRIRMIGEENLSRRDYGSLPHYRSTILLIESPDKSILLQDDMDILSG